jgi:hypothetical protein
MTISGIQEKHIDHHKSNIMKNLLLFVIISGCFVVFSCKKKESDRFKFLTSPIWVADSLLANGVDATGPGGILSSFIGDAKFNTDGTGYFGSYTGTWRFNSDETKLVIETDSLPIPVVADIKELTSSSLKVTTVLPNPLDPLSPFNIRMTFKPK